MTIVKDDPQMALDEEVIVRDLEVEGWLAETRKYNMQLAELKIRRQVTRDALEATRVLLETRVEEWDPGRYRCGGYIIVVGLTKTIRWAAVEELE